MSLEQLAALAARMEAGAARERVLAEAGVTADAWEQARAFWFSRMVTEAGRNNRLLHERYTGLVREHLPRAIRDERAWVRKVAAPVPVAPTAHLSPLHAHPLLSSVEALPERVRATPADMPPAHVPEEGAVEQTLAPALIPRANPLPFRSGEPGRVAAALPSLLPPVQDTDAEAGTTTVSASMEERTDRKNALPFQPAAPERRAPTAEQATTPEPLPSLAQYASLCAELAVFPHAAESIFQRYGLADRAHRAAVDAVWKERLRREPATYRSWQERYRHYHAACTTRARPRGT